MARGRFTYTMDAKGRVAMPQQMRDEVKPHGARPPVLTNFPGVPAIAVYSAQDWDEIESRIKGMSQVQPELQALSRLMISGAFDCDFDGQGRLTVPADLREYAGLQRDVVLAGIGKRIEIWDKARFEREVAAAKDRGPELARGVAGLGL
jgi:MraZ protein